jgi:UDP-N-acetylglucosamine--N-acetylmuramyl-(pentapeptide) pyrophosphoryl-undecaprenol N-acetylglucosamine transferase
MAEATSRLSHLKSRIRLIHLCGNEASEMGNVYAKSGLEAQVFPFYPHMSELYRVSDLVIGRAGGSTLAEIQAVGIPAILIPFARAAEGHQLANALSMQKQNAALVVQEHELNGQVLAQAIEGFLDTPARLEAMALQAKAMGKPHAAHEIAYDILRLLEIKVQESVAGIEVLEVNPAPAPESLRKREGICNISI